MKKTYTKPEISFESFLMSTNIAGDCNVKTDTKGNMDCGLYFTGFGMVFMTGINGCTGLEVEVDGSFNGICYHVPTEKTDLFNS